MPTPAILFYTASSQTQERPPDITWIKTCLSQTLSKFYPLAGQVITQSTLDCNDEGIPVFETQVNCSLSTVLNSPILQKGHYILDKFFPPPESLCIAKNNQQICELAHTCIQINVFSCRRVGLAWYDIHKLHDGMSSADFLNHWASLASRKYDEIKQIQPNFDAAITAFPPSPDEQPLLIENEYDQGKQRDCSLVVKNFIFRDAALNKLKQRAASQKVLHPSRFLAVTGFIWEQALASKTCQPKDKTACIVPLNMRARMNPPLPEASIGNLFTQAVALAHVKATLPELVANIHTAISDKNEEIKEYKGEKGVKVIRENTKKFLKTCLEYKDMAYGVTSWCNLGINDLDFGFEKPKWMVLTDGKPNGSHMYFIILNDYTDSGGAGIEAWLFLEEKEMQILESNPLFLEFASPATSSIL